MESIKTSRFGFSKRKVQVSLGLLWLLDGALQLQHQMFSSNFATQVIAPAAQGQPRFVSGVMNFGMHLFLLHPAVFDSLFAATQLAIGLLILWKRTANIGLIFSVIWGLTVWVAGEGYGGIFTAHTLILMGAPGAALLYVLLALAALPNKRPDKDKKTHSHPAYWLAIVWLVLWFGGGVYQLLPGQNSTADISSMIAANAPGAPGWLASVDSHVAKSIQHLGSGQTQGDSNMHMTNAQMAHMTSQPSNSAHPDSGYLFILLIAGLQFFIALGILRAGIIRNLAIGLGILLSLSFWVVGQSLGGYYTGLATDPNTAPLIILLALAILGCTNLDRQLSKLGERIEDLLV